MSEPQVAIVELLKRVVSLERVPIAIERVIEKYLDNSVHSSTTVALATEIRAILAGKNRHET